MAKGKRGKAAARRRKDKQRADIAAGPEYDTRTPARHTAGEWQIAQRSSEADRERLAHLPVTLFDYEGVAAHVAGTAAPRRFTRPETGGDVRMAYGLSGAHSNEVPMPQGRGAPPELIDNPCPTLAAIEARVERQQNAGPRLIANPETTRDHALNRLAAMTPLRRLAWLRRIVTVRPQPPETTLTATTA